MKQEIVTPRAAAQRLAIGIDSVYALLWSGKLAGKRVDGRWLIPAEAVAARLRAKEARRGTASR